MEAAPDRHLTVTDDHSLDEPAMKAREAANKRARGSGALAKPSWSESGPVAEGSNGLIDLGYHSPSKPAWRKQRAPMGTPWSRAAVSLGPPWMRERISVG